MNLLFSSNKKKLKDVLKEMKPFKLKQQDVPFIIRFIKNPKYDIGFFPGAVSLLNRDCIHVLLGRGVLDKDEAFVIGYIMGSTKKMTTFKEKLFLFISRYLYPKGYRFGKGEAKIFEYGLIAGKKSCKDLSKIDFKWFLSWTLKDIRSKLGVDIDFLKLCYILEKKAFPNSPESQRLI